MNYIWKKFVPRIIISPKTSFEKNTKTFFQHFIDLSLDINNIYGDIVYQSLKLIKIDRPTPLAHYTADRA